MRKIKKIVLLIFVLLPVMRSVAFGQSVILIDTVHSDGTTTSASAKASVAVPDSFIGLNADPDGTYFTVKTNVLLLGALVSNIGLEIPSGRHLSVDIPFIYSPYTVRRDYRLRALMIQPELRYWLQKPMVGHFFGFHAHAGYFNVATNSKKRYQDTDGNSPLWGFGLSYGYALELWKNWGAEFTLGAGYANIRYDVFYNIPNGAKFDSGTKNYWGVTRAGISLVYKFNIQFHRQRS